MPGLNPIPIPGSLQRGRLSVLRKPRPRRGRGAQGRVIDPVGLTQVNTGVLPAVLLLLCTCKTKFFKAYKARRLRTSERYFIHSVVHVAPRLSRMPSAACVLLSPQEGQRTMSRSKLHPQHVFALCGMGQRFRAGTS